MKKLLIGIGIAAGLAICAAVVFLAVTDFSRYRSDLEIAISEATGRELRIEGDFQPDVFPLSFVAEDVSFANAEWGSEQPFLQIGHISVRASITSLFSGPFTIYEFHLGDVTVLLEENESGDGNWQIEVDDPDLDPGVGIRIEEEINAEPIILELAEVRNLSVIYRRPGREDRVLVIETIDVAQNESGFMEAAATGSLDGDALTASGAVGPGENFTTGADIEYQLESRLGPVAFNLSGRTAGNASPPDFEATLKSDDVGDILAILDTAADVSGPLAVEATLDTGGEIPVLKLLATAGELRAEADATFFGEQVSVNASLQPLNRFGQVFDVSGLPEQPLSIAGDVTALPEGIALTDVELRVESFSMLVNGLIGNEPDTGNRFKIEFAADSLADYDEDLPDISLASTLSAVVAPGHINIPEFDIQFDDSDLSGTAELKMSDKPSVTANVHASVLDVTPFSSQKEAAAEQETSADETTNPEEAPQDLVFRDEPLPFEILDVGTADIRIAVDRYIDGPLELQDIESSIMLNDGNLTTDFGFSVAAGGEAKAALTLVSKAESADLDLELNVSDLRLSLSDDDKRQASDIPLVGMVADITSSGSTPRALAAGLNGKLLFTQGPGKVDNSAVGFFSADFISELLSALNPFSKDEPFSTWECTVFAVNFTDGTGQIEPMLAQSEKVKIVGDGTIDLVEEKLDIGFNTEPRSGVGISADMFVTPFVRLGGTLAEPRVALDKGGILVSGGAAILTGGLSFFVKGAADRASGTSDRCAAALAIANGEDVELEN